MAAISLPLDAASNVVITNPQADDVLTYDDATGRWINSPAGAPSAHASAHQSGGSDPIALDTLDTPTDTTDLNATAGHHGLLPKLSGDAATYLDGEGNWTAPTSSTLPTITITETTPGSALVPAVNEVQSIELIGADVGAPGTLTLTWGGDTTDPLDLDASAATIDAALEALASIGADEVTVTGGPLGTSPILVEFVGTLAGAPQALITAEVTPDAASPAAVINTTQQGAAGDDGTVNDLFVLGVKENPSGVSWPYMTFGVSGSPSSGVWNLVFTMNGNEITTQDLQWNCTAWEVAQAITAALQMQYGAANYAAVPGVDGGSNTVLGGSAVVAIRSDSVADITAVDVVDSLLVGGTFVPSIDGNASGSAPSPAGTFKLLLNGVQTADIDWADIEAADIESACDALALGAATVTAYGNQSTALRWFTIDIPASYELTIEPNFGENGTNPPEGTENLDLSRVTAGDGTPGTPEIQTLELTDTAGGTFTITCDEGTTAAIDWDADAATVEAALSGAGLTADVTGGALPAEITITWPTNAGNVGEITADVAGLTGDVPDVDAEITHDTNGAAEIPGVDEVQEVLLNDTTSGEFTLFLEGDPIGPINWDADSTAVTDAFTAAGLTVTVDGDAGGPWAVTFGGAWAETDVPLMTSDASGLFNGIVNQVVSLDLAEYVAAEAIPSSSLVHIDQSTGEAYKADNSLDREAHGFTIPSVVQGGTVAVKRIGRLFGLVGKTTGKRQWLGTGGQTTETPPSEGLIQDVGLAESGSAVFVEVQPAIVLV